MKTMSVREFLRGGYLEITEPTVIMKHGVPVATWTPQKRKERRPISHDEQSALLSASKQ